MLPHANLAGLLVLSLELLSLATSSNAIPSFQFTKSPYSNTHSNTNVESHSPPSSGHSNPGKTPSTLKEDNFDLERLCPSVYDAKFATQERKLKHSVSRAKQHRKSGESSYTPIQVNIVWHSVAANETELGGFMPYHRMQTSVDILNQHFAPANIQFNLNRVDRYGNARWYHEVGFNNALSYEMRAQTHVGDAQVLNIWSTGFSNVFNTGGYVALFPWELTVGNRDDGVTMRHDFFYGSNHFLFNDGKYLTHEVGHWCGLYHTFEGGCGDFNDGVEDTPAQGSPTYVGDNTCTPTDTCPSVAGYDPVSNFMDYSHPDCQSGFTPGQIDRMRAIMHDYRGFPL